MNKFYWNLLRLVILVFLVTACAPKNDLILVVDTSGSMKKNNQFQKVKQSIKNLLLESYQKFENVHVVEFSKESKPVMSMKISTNSDLVEVYKTLDELEASGNWTNLVGVMDDSLQKIRKIRGATEGKNVTLIIYTDGKHDLPEGESDLRFGDLLDKYYGNYSPTQQDWFIYYVELEEKDPEFQDFLEKSKSGVVIDKENATNTESFAFTKKDYTEMAIGGLGAILLLLLIRIVLNLRKPWFGDHVIYYQSKTGSGGNNKINLDMYRKPLFNNYLIIGSKAKISLPGLEKKHALIGVSGDGKIYIKPIGKSKVLVHNSPARKRTFIKNGYKFTVGNYDFNLVLEKK
jgi:hypothetical protein